MRKNEEEQSTMLLLYGRSILIGGAGAMVLSLLLLLIAATGISRGILDARLQNQLTVVICVVSSFAGGLYAVRQCGSKSLLVGLAVGIVLFLLQLTVGLLFFDTLSLENGGIGFLCSALCGGAAAGILGRGGARRSAKGKRRRPR